MAVSKKGNKFMHGSIKVNGTTVKISCFPLSKRKKGQPDLRIYVNDEESIAVLKGVNALDFFGNVKEDSDGDQADDNIAQEDKPQQLVKPIDHKDKYEPSKKKELDVSSLSETVSGEPPF
jgi:hypothetical protein